MRSCFEGVVDKETVETRYLIQVAGHNLGILMRLLISARTPKKAALGFICDPISPESRRVSTGTGS